MTPHDEVKRLHRCIAAWLRGDVEKSPQAFATVGETLHDEFEMISPRAVIDSRQQFLNEFYERHGLWRDKGYDIEIHGLTSIWATAGYQLVRYEEWHTGKDPVEIRLSSALFECDHHGNWFWLHLHETWLQPA